LGEYPEGEVPKGKNMKASSRVNLTGGFFVFIAQNFVDKWGTLSVLLEYFLQ